MKTEERKIYSKRLNREVIIEGYEYNGMFLALHYALEKLVSEINIEDKIRLSINIEKPIVTTLPNENIPYVIYTGYVSDGDVTIPCNGDASLASLNNEISRKYPGEMAFKRCYDRGVLTWLYLQPKDNKKIYSDSEMDAVLQLSSFKDISLSSTEKEEIKKEEVLKVVEISDTEEETATFSISDDTAPSTPAVTPYTTDAEDIVITEGKYKKNPQPISEIVKTESGKQWLQMAITNKWIPEESRRAIVEKWLA